MNKKLRIANTIIPFIGPIAFEISNVISGDWVDKSGKFYLSSGKLITSIIGISYIICMIYLLIKSSKYENNIEDLENKIKDEKNRINSYEKSVDSMCTLLAYTSNNVNEQIDFFRSNGKIDVRNININTAATTICKIIYDNICDTTDSTIKITVNMYEKYKEDGKMYSTMIAHEGHASNPSAFGIKRLLKKSKGTRYSEKIMMDNAPDYKIILDKAGVARAFGQNSSGCKYSQYLAIPIRKKGGDTIALIEIVAHNNSVIWKTEDEANEFVAKYCEIFKEYVLLINQLYEQNETFAHKLEKEAC